MNLVEELYVIAATLSSANIPYAVCGGVAVSAHGAPRATKDIDMVIARGDLPTIISLIRPLGFTHEALPMVFEEGTPRERHIQRVSKLSGKDHLLLDLLLAEGAFAGALDDRVEMTLPEGPLTIVSRDTLLRLKRLAGRPRDISDIERLEVPDEDV